MKKYLLTLLLVSQPIFSELVLEITKGSDNPYSIALINFDGSKTAKINRYETTVGRAILSEILPAGLPFESSPNLFCQLLTLSIGAGLLGDRSAFSDYAVAASRPKTGCDGDHR